MPWLLCVHWTAHSENYLLVTLPVCLDDFSVWNMMVSVCSLDRPFIEYCQRVNGSRIWMHSLSGSVWLLTEALFPVLLITQQDGWSRDYC